jgi:hypothetical protein
VEPPPSVHSDSEASYSLTVITPFTDARTQIFECSHPIVTHATFISSPTKHLYLPRHLCIRPWIDSDTRATVEAAIRGWPCLRLLRSSYALFKQSKGSINMKRLITHSKYIPYAARHASFPSTSMTSYSMRLSEHVKVISQSPIHHDRGLYVESPSLRRFLRPCSLPYSGDFLELPSPKRPKKIEKTHVTSVPSTFASLRWIAV